MSTSGCSRRYRSSLRTCSAGPGGTSCTGQYHYPVRGRRNRLSRITRQSPATVVAVVAMSASRPHARARAHDKSRHHLRIWGRCRAAPVHHQTVGYRPAQARPFRAQTGRRTAHPHADVSTSPLAHSNVPFRLLMHIGGPSLSPAGDTANCDKAAKRFAALISEFPALDRFTRHGRIVGRRWRLIRTG
jgi:hypothetical protein